MSDAAALTGQHGLNENDAYRPSFRYRRQGAGRSREPFTSKEK